MALLPLLLATPSVLLHECVSFPFLFQYLSPSSSSLQVSYAIVSSAQQAVRDGPSSPSSQRKRPRTDAATDNGDAADQTANLFVEKASPIALAKAIKNNNVCAIATLFAFNA